MGIDWNVCRRASEELRQQVGVGRSLGSGTASELIVCPSRGKIRISEPPACASRASTGTSRRSPAPLLGDHEILAGPLRLRDDPLPRLALASVSCAVSNALRRNRRMSLRGMPNEPSRLRFSGVPTNFTYSVERHPLRENGLAHPLNGLLVLAEHVLHRSLISPAWRTLSRSTIAG